MCKQNLKKFRFAPLYLFTVVNVICVVQRGVNPLLWVVVGLTSLVLALDIALFILRTRNRKGGGIRAETSGNSPE